MYSKPLLVIIFISLSNGTPIGLGVLDISENSELTVKQRFEEVTRLDCASQREKAQGRKAAGNLKIYVPTCSMKNPLLYEKIQCYEVSSYCWCVDEWSGEPRVGSPTSSGKPTCIEQTTPAPKKKRKRCKAKRRTRYLRRLVASIKTEMIVNGINETTISRETAIRWKFNNLNKDGNNYIERIEWKPYKMSLLGWKNVKHCSRNLFKTCDTDKDKRLTFTEWRRCIVYEISMSPAQRPDQLNPFLYILKPE